MKKMIQFFPVLALVLGVSFAFAGAHDSGKKFATRKQAFYGSAWHDITSTTQYSCVGVNNDCTRMLDENNNVVPGSVIKGSYTPVEP